MKKILSISIALIVISALDAQVLIQTPMPAQTGTFSSNVRGYWFVSPTCFTITGAMVPTDNAGNQSIAIVRFAANPPLYSATTNVFDTLFLTQNNTNPGIISGLNLLINQGDIIGVLGCRGTTTSYSSTGNTTLINGISVPLSRLGMQFPLPTNIPQQLWTEASTNIGRTYLYYDSVMVYNLSVSNLGADYTFADGTDTLYTSLFSVWDYGDGSPLDTNYNPTHSYTSNGNYNVCSYVNTGCGIDTVCTSINVCYFNATAGFSSSTAGLDATFTDASTNATSWSWDFGDGNTDTVQNPIHTYASMGWYYVTQIASNSCGLNDTILDSVLICTPPLTGTFIASNLSTTTVTFTDASIDATSWGWDFGDGNTSTTQNPTHNYLTNGTYNVCLIVQNLCGADTTCMAVVACPNDPTASFTNTNTVFDASFTNSSSFATSSLWDFGDGNTSTTTNPSHTYATAGTYFVCLTSIDECNDSTTFCDSVTIVGNVGLETIANIQSMNSYPNPTNGSANITINSSENIKGKLFVTDITGKIVSTIHTGTFMAGPTQFVINTTIWTNGIYLLVWETDKWKVSKKLLVN